MNFGPRTWARPFLLALTVLGVQSTAAHIYGAERGQDPLKGFDEFVSEALADWQVPGMAIAVVKDSKVVLARGYGVCRQGEDARVDERTVFRIASCTKSFTATCLGILVDEGRLKWDDPVVKHLPEFQLYDPFVTREVTIRDLMCHRTGLESGHLLVSRGDYDIAEILRRMRFLKPVAGFRSRPDYHNLSYFVAGAVAAKISGKNWDDLVQERILSPLGMTSTLTSYWARAQLQSKNATTPHVRVDGKVEPNDWQPKEYRGPNHGAGGMHSNLIDMAEWLKVHLAAGAYGEKRLLKAATLREMHAAHAVNPVGGGAQSILPYPKSFFGYGLGWMVRDYRGRKLVFHTGSSGAVMAMMPEENLGVVVLANVEGTGLVSMVMHDVLDRYLGFARPWSTKDWLEVSVVGPESAAREARKRRESARVKNTKPSCPLPAYTGAYENDLYGRVEVKQDGDALIFRFGEMVADLSHWQHDSFQARFRKPHEETWLVKCAVNAAGAVGRLDVDLWDSGGSLPAFKRVEPAPAATEKKISPEAAAQVNGLFTKWDRPDSPGFALAIVRGGKVIYQRGYGMANLDEGVPLSAQSVFQVWSLTKTFTTMCVALLLDQGKISLDDPVAKLVPELPAYDPPVTIRHLVQCTSGLRDYYLTMQLAGWNWRDAWTGHDVLDLLSRRKTLTDKPGAKFQYSNSDYLILGLVIERASGMSLRRFAQEHLFGPLGMKSTYFDDDPTAIVKHRAIGHERRWTDRRFYQSMIQSNTVGAFDMKTTIDDLVHWDGNFYDNRLKNGAHLRAFLKQGHLDNRNVLEAYPKETYRGAPRNWYTGGGPGYFAHVCRFPQQRFTVILLSNLAEESEWLHMTRAIQQIADLLLADQLTPTRDTNSERRKEIEVVKLAESDLQEKAGLYRGPGGLFQRLVVRNGQLTWVNPFQHTYPLVPFAPSRFRSRESPAGFDLVFTKTNADNPLGVTLTQADGSTAQWKRVQPVTPTSKQLKEYTGNFFCDELQTTYRLSVDDGQLAFQVNNSSKRRLSPMIQDVFIPADRLKAEWVFTFVRSDQGAITGFVLDVSRTRGILFKYHAPLAK